MACLGDVGSGVKEIRLSKEKTRKVVRHQQQNYTYNHGNTYASTDHLWETSTTITGPCMSPLISLHSTARILCQEIRHHPTGNEHLLDNNLT